MCVFITAGPITKLFAESLFALCVCLANSVCVYYCRTYYKAVRVGEEDSGEKVSFINENTPRAPTGTKNTRKPARLSILR